VGEYQVELKLNGTHQLLVYADNVNAWEDNTDTVLGNEKHILMLEIHVETTKYMLLSHH
jgi:hypothetical protein